MREDATPEASSAARAAGTSAAAAGTAATTAANALQRGRHDHCGEVNNFKSLTL